MAAAKLAAPSIYGERSNDGGNSHGLPSSLSVILGSSAIRRIEKKIRSAERLKTRHVCEGSVDVEAHAQSWLDLIGAILERGNARDREGLINAAGTRVMADPYL
jgi:hypothetical protein